MGLQWLYDTGFISPCVSQSEWQEMYKEISRDAAQYKNFKNDVQVILSSSLLQIMWSNKENKNSTLCVHDNFTFNMIYRL